jgi:hypothetical protein
MSRPVDRTEGFGERRGRGRAGATSDRAFGASGFGAAGVRKPAGVIRLSEMLEPRLAFRADSFAHRVIAGGQAVQLPDGFLMFWPVLRFGPGRFHHRVSKAPPCRYRDCCLGLRQRLSSPHHLLGHDPGGINQCQRLADQSVSPLTERVTRLALPLRPGEVVPQQTRDFLDMFCCVAQPLARAGES